MNTCNMYFDQVVLSDKVYLVCSYNANVCLCLTVSNVLLNKKLYEGLSEKTANFCGSLSVEYKPLSLHPLPLPQHPTGVVESAVRFGFWDELHADDIEFRAL